MAALLEKENKNLQEEHEKQIIAYKKHKEVWINKQLSKKKRVAIYWTVGYLIIVSLACVISFCKLDGVLAFFATLFMVLVPFVRPMWNHRKIIDSIYFLFCKKVYSLEIKKLELAYSKIEPRPKFSGVTKEDIVAKLNEK